MRLVLDPSKKKDTLLGFEWFEPISYGYDQEGRLETIVGIAPFFDNTLVMGKVGIFAIEGPELHDDLMMNYLVQQWGNGGNADD